MGLSIIPKDPIERLLSKVKAQSVTGCWLWTAHTENGYGRFGVKENNKWKTTWAHRVSYKLFVGKIPDGLQLDHLCRQRSCVNPNHLDPVTMMENIRRSSLTSVNKTHCKLGHELIKTKTQKRCVVCSRISRKKYEEKNG